MKKQTRGFGLGGKNGGERKRDEPRKKKAPPVTSGWKSKKPKTEETAEPSPGSHQPSYEVRQIKIADIKIEGKRRSLNSEKLNELMEFVSELGLRQSKTKEQTKFRTETEGKSRSENSTLR